MRPLRGVDPRLLSSGDVAALLGCHRMGVIAWANDGRLRHTRLANGWRVFRKADAVAFERLYRVKAHRVCRAGELSTQAILTAADVVEMRRLYAGGVKQAEIGRRFGVCRGTAWDVVHGKSWGSLK